MASIELRNVRVSYPVFGKRRRSFKRDVLALGTGGRIGVDEGNRLRVEALRNVSLSLEHGDRVALVGHNGAGKSTMLRVLAGIYEPTTGTVEVEGSVAPVLDFAQGMDAESSGYENIRIRGLFLGLSNAEIERKTAEIAEFTELGEFLEMPIRTYSAGMRARLAFAISTSIDPDILLLDEGVGAGDASFTMKARQRVEDLISRSGILVLATHSTALAKDLCDKALWLKQGEIVGWGDVEEVIEKYQASLGKRRKADHDDWAA